MTIAVDFDGVIHQYSKGWQDGTIYDPPVEGVKEALEYLASQDHKILIFSTRSNPIYTKGRSADLDQNEQMRAFLETHDIPFTKIWKYGKPMADVYIDDRAIPFTGNWSETIELVNKFKPWNR